MKGYIGYIRVSTVKQGTQGVSLQEQKDAILRYAEKNGYPIGHWMEEMVTAGKQGRPLFNEALKLLRSGKAKGIILHKLDRGARNLRDWASIGELSDQGIEVHFVTESLDLQTRGGRLAADIQAVVAADYIRNLREETRKGFYGRLKQGLYPMGAPIGYLDQGKGKAKIPDPQQAPLIRMAFEEYATGKFNLESLRERLTRAGLRTKTGKKLTLGGLSLILNNPFYMGIIRIKKTNESFIGIHKPLIDKMLFKRVQAVLKGKVCTRNTLHSFTFRRLLTCTKCSYSLIGERQKGHVYYRCHTRTCHGTSVREDNVEAAFLDLLAKIQFNEEELKVASEYLLNAQGTWANQREESIKGLRLQAAHVQHRLNRLTDAYLDQVLDKQMFEERKTALLMDKKAIDEKLTQLAAKDGAYSDSLGKILELVESPLLSHAHATPEEKRGMISIFTSNIQVNGKNIAIEPSLPFRELADRNKPDPGAPHRDTPRTFQQILEDLAKQIEAGVLPELNFRKGCEENDIGKEISMEG